MAAPMKAVLGLRVTPRLTNPSPCSRTLLRSASWWRFSKRSDDEQEKEPTARKLKQSDGPTTVSRLESLKKKTDVCTVRGYKPPHDVEAKISSIANTLIGSSVEPTFKLDERLLKFKLLTKLMEEFDHTIPNTELSTMNTLEDVVTFFSTPVRDHSSYDDLAKQNLPKNLHIQMEPVRFDPDTDTFFDGKTAFPDRPTIVTSLKYSRKYKGNSGESRNSRSLTEFEKQKQFEEDVEKLKIRIDSREN